jgi:hypothetical protein
MPRKKNKEYQPTQDQTNEIDNAPESYKKILTEAYSGRSMASAVKAMCRQCNGYEQAARRTRECHIETCPLWRFRR